MSRLGTVTWLAIRELWMSFRLVVLLLALVGVGAAVALLPAPLPVTMGRLSAGLAAAALVAAAIAAWSVAEDRIRGRAGWLVTRSVPRASFLGGWFLAITLIVAFGALAASILGWLAASAVALRLAAPAFAATAGAVVATLVAAVALGTAVGLVLGPRTAAIVTIVLGAAAIGAAWTVPGAAAWVPGGAFAALAALDETPPPLTAAGRDAGIALVATAALLAVGRVAVERADL